MCGIVGLIYKDAQVDRYNFATMRDTMSHRGPDDADTEYFEDMHIALGQRRLSFLDLSSAGRQPMSNEDGKVWIVLNGEIYNYIELRKELEAAGHTFKTHTDTEVIVHGYEQWGEDVVNRLKGMFAFGVLDLARQKLFLARDRFGIKPLYYTITDKYVVFASELKAIVSCKDVPSEVDLTSIADYLVYRYVPSPKTIWKGIHKLPPAHTLTFDYRSFTAQTSEYWKLTFNQKNRSKPEQLAARFGVMLANSVAIHARADVPIGSFLSGGYDSSAVVHYLKEAGYTPDTFAIGFKDWDNSEHRYASMVADKLDVPFNFFLAEEATLDLLDIMPDVYDEPIADISILPTWLVSHEAAKKVKAVMSGEGADELLGGYWWQKKLYGMSNPEPVTWRDKLRKYLGQPAITEPIDRLEFYSEANAMGRFNREELLRAFAPELHSIVPQDPEWFYRQHFDSSLSPLKSFQRMDIKCFMGELVLVKVDRASMASSLEVRVPFLDHEIFDYVLTASEHRYFKPEVTKYLLNDNIKNHLPDEIMQRPKQGFVGPDDFYIKVDRYRSILKDCELVKAGIINQEYIDSLFETTEHWKLWKLAVLEGWYRRWVTGLPIESREHVFVFVVCGAKEHIDTLHYALRSLQNYSNKRILVVTDSARNEEAVRWDNIVDVNTPEEFNHHQASIYLKTGLNRFLPKGPLYCYLDTDVIAVDDRVDEIFSHYTGPINFAPDHCTMNYFSYSAVKCSCAEVYSREMAELLEVIAYSETAIPGEDWAAHWRRRFPDWTWLEEDNDWISPSGHRPREMNCVHLVEEIECKFNVRVTNPRWQHWNGGVFLFTRESDVFLNSWHNKTMEIFKDPKWKTRDQGTLIATAWEFGLQDTATLPRQFNLIVDYNSEEFNSISEDQETLTVDASKVQYTPRFVHVYHHFGDTTWNIWNWVETRAHAHTAVLKPATSPQKG